MRWTPVAIPNSSYFTIGEDTHFGKWQVEGGLTHDRHVLTLIAGAIPPGTIAVDVGAFNGDHALAYAQIAATVYAFEPQLPIFLNLCTNVFLGRHYNVIPERVALGDKEGVVAFSDWIGAPENYGARPATSASSVQSKISVPLTTLDRYLERDPGRVGFIKIDAEGWEPEILTGAMKTISVHRPALYVEINDGALRRRGSTSGDLVSKLEGLGYRLQYVGGKLGDPQFDVLCR